MKKSTIVAAVSGFIGGGLATLALSHRRKKARQELEAIVIDTDSKNEIIRQQMDTIGTMINQSLLTLEEGLDERPWSQFDDQDGKIVRFPEAR